MFDLLQKIKKLECKSTNVPIEQSHKMGYEEESVKSYKNKCQILQESISEINEKVDLLDPHYVIFYVCN